MDHGMAHGCRSLAGIGSARACNRVCIIELHAMPAYTAGMQYTLRKIPARLDEALRRRAREQNKSRNEVAIDALMRAFGLAGQPVKHRELADIVGTWQEDPELERVFADQRKVDPELWQ